MEVTDAVIHACATRTRPIIITALALMVGSSVILSDPIFQGMAVSLMMGGLVSTVLTLIVIPLGCVSFRQALSEKVAAEKAVDVALHKEVPETNTLPRRSRGGASVLLAVIGNTALLIGEMIGFVIVSIFKGFGKIFGADSKPTIQASVPQPEKSSTPPPVVKVEEPKPVVVQATPVKKAAKPKVAKADPKPAAPAKKPAAKKMVAKKPRKSAPAKTATKTAKKPAAKKPAAKKPTTRSKAKASGRRGIRLKKPTDSTEE